MTPAKRNQKNLNEKLLSKLSVCFIQIQNLFSLQAMLFAKGITSDCNRYMLTCCHYAYFCYQSNVFSGEGSGAKFEKMKIDGSVSRLLVRIVVFLLLLEDTICTM